MTIEEYVEQFRIANPAAKNECIARSVGISRPYLSQILAGKREPGGDTMKSIFLRTGGAVTMESWVYRSPSATV